VGSGRSRRPPCGWLRRIAVGLLAGSLTGAAWSADLLRYDVRLDALPAAAQQWVQERRADPLVKRVWLVSVDLRVLKNDEVSVALPDGQRLTYRHQMLPSMASKTDFAIWSGYERSDPEQRGGADLLVGYDPQGGFAGSLVTAHRARSLMLTALRGVPGTGVLLEVGSLPGD